jgi:hypothetical protein
MAETKTDAVQLIARIRRAMPLNRDVMDAMDLLERAVVSTRRAVVTTDGSVVSTVVSTKCQCVLCVRRRAAKSRTMKAWRSRRKTIDPMDQPITPMRG